VLEQWKTNLGINARHSTHSLIIEAMNVIVSQPGFYAALLNVGADSSGKPVNDRRLGWWFERIEGRIINGLKFRQDGKKQGHPVWKLAEAKD
jgi:hypothetical protein